MVKWCGAQNMFQGDVFTIAGWIPGSSTMTGIVEVRRLKLIMVHNHNNNGQKIIMVKI